MARPAILFDRDGTLNVDRGYTFRPSDLEWTPGAREAVKRVNDAGFLAVVVTNQSGVARGFYAEADVVAFHEAMIADLATIGARLDALYYCPFHADATLEAYRHADHPDRKPNPGMLLRAMAEFDLDPQRVVMIGDQASDLAAAAAAGVRGALYSGGDLAQLVQDLLANLAD
jgi:D-glycero-D-manno-heptose 1,7-bisphosphate phosphatase